LQVTAVKGCLADVDVLVIAVESFQCHVWNPCCCQQLLLMRLACCCALVVQVLHASAAWLLLHHHVQATGRASGHDIELPKQFV
jgi:hypothetical protein